MANQIPQGRDWGIFGRKLDLDDLLGKFYEEFPFVANGNSFRVDVRESDNYYVVEADLPGIKKENIGLKFQNGYLMISAKKEDSKETIGEEKYIHKERSYGEFVRSLYMDDADENSVTAKFENGVLNIQVAKLVKPKQDNNIIIQ